MLHVKFAERDGDGARSADPGTLMKLVSRNTKRGAQFTPQGVLRWPLTSAKAEDVLSETKALLESLDTTNVVIT
jgi:transcription-repair coupling factor (superfamily II helicase)